MHLRGCAVRSYTRDEFSEVLSERESLPPSLLRDLSNPLRRQVYPLHKMGESLVIDGAGSLPHGGPQSHTSSPDLASKHVLLLGSSSETKALGVRSFCPSCCAPRCSPYIVISVRF